MATAQKYAKLDPFFRGDTPLFIVPIIGGVDLTGWNAFLTFNTQQFPVDNSNALFHVPMGYSAGDTLNLTSLTGQPYSNYLYYQFTNANTENMVPGGLYYWDVQINKDPVQTNNFTLQVGTFTPNGDISRGLS